MRIFAIFTSIIAIYVSSSFVRLELFASVGIIILGSIGLAILSQKIFEQKNQNFTKLIFPVIIIFLFIIPVTLPENNNWLSWADFPPSILNGGSAFSQFASDDWKDAMIWLKENTHEDAIIASWWDYGYWITTLSDRTTLADNATLIDWQIKKIGFALITNPENSWHILSSDHSEDISEYLGEENVFAWGGQTYSDWLSENETNKDCKRILKTSLPNSMFLVNTNELTRYKAYDNSGNCYNLEINVGLIKKIFNYNEHETINLDHINKEKEII